MSGHTVVVLAVQPARREATELPFPGHAKRSGIPRAGTLEMSDVQHGTFTLSSAGMLGPPVHGTPLIAPGQAGVLLAGGIADRPVVRDGAVVAGQVLPLSLTFDHAVMNGAPAMAFLGDLIERVEAPGPWLP